MDDARRENTNGLNSDFDYFTLNNMHQPFTEEQDDGGHTSTHHVFTAKQPKVIKSFTYIFCISMTTNKVTISSLG